MEKLIRERQKKVTSQDALQSMFSDRDGSDDTLKPPPNRSQEAVRGFSTGSLEARKMDKKEVKAAAKTIKKRLKEKNVWIETRSQGEDAHILVGKRDHVSNKVHIVIDGKTAEIRVEDNQTAPEELIKSIESTLTLNDGRVVKFSRELLELEKYSWQDEVDGFTAHVVQIGGVGSLVFTSTAWSLTEHGYLTANKFVSIGFTSGGDMIVGPKEGFEIVDCNSPSGNTIEDVGLPKACLLILEDKLKNEIMITCKKTTLKTSGLLANDTTWVTRV